MLITYCKMIAKIKKFTMANKHEPLQYEISACFFDNITNFISHYLIKSYPIRTLQTTQSAML